ncbi:MAG: hypothetical protein RLZZ455_857 [Candidatus Parcubacteria bacterium]|jgi:hypothetical protein
MAVIERPLNIKVMLSRQADPENPPRVDIALHALHHPPGIPIAPKIFVENGLEQIVYRGAFGNMFLPDLDRQRKKIPPPTKKLTRLILGDDGSLRDPRRRTNVVDIQSRIPVNDVVIFTHEDLGAVGDQ